MRLRFLDYEASRTVPNIVVDGSANGSTVLTLSHWPGADTPPGLARDLSAEMAFAYRDNPCEHAPVEVVTNNHFDQDGLVAVYALAEPTLSIEHRDLLIDVAAAGDFGTYRDRRAARASMVIAHWSDVGWSYGEALPLLLPLALDPEPYRDLWDAEDAQLTASEAAISAGRITIAEHRELDLAVVTIPDDEPSRGGHRFAHQSFDGLHPMALHNATGCFRILLLHGNRYRYVDRYETWVQFQSRPTLNRVDMRPLAAKFNAVDTVRWRAGSPNDLSPVLDHEGASSLPADTVTALLTDHLGPSTQRPDT